MTIEPKILDAKIHNLKFWITECDAEKLREMFQEYLQEVNFTVLNCVEHHFPIQGYTVFWLLAESHLAIHTFPDKNRSYVELSSCNNVKAEQFRELLVADKLPIEWCDNRVVVLQADELHGHYSN